jgi:FkbM family methyltransferase
MDGRVSVYSEALRIFCPQPLLNWREARFLGRYGEVELHLVEFLCRRDADALDIGANDGRYVHYLRRHARRVVAYEPMPSRARELRRKFPRSVTIEPIALSDTNGTLALHGPDTVQVPMNRLDNVYHNQAGFIRIDADGHEQAVLDGAVETIRRHRPRLLVEIDDRLSPGGLTRARAYFDRLGYRGYFVQSGHLEPIQRFSIAEMQQPENLPDLSAPMPARARFGRYIDNFIFLPREEPERTLMRISERLVSLLQ